MTKRLELPPWATSDATKAYWGDVVAEGIREKWNVDGGAAEALAERCPTCHNAGFILQIKRERGILISKDYVACNNPLCPERRAVAIRKYGEVSAASQIPVEYKKMNFDQWRKLLNKKIKRGEAHPMDGKRDALGAALAFVAAHGNEFRFTLAEAAERVNLPIDPNVDNDAAMNCIVFSGLYGTGKTSLTCAIANALMEQQISIVYVRMGNLFLALRDTFNSGQKGDTEGKVIGLYKTAPVLILDELGLKASEWEQEMGFALLDYRYSNGLPTLITTNLPTQETMVNTWGHAMGDRIIAMSHWLVLGGVQLRPRHAAKLSR